MSSRDYSKEFHIRAGVRQGCVLSPHLFCAVLEWAMCDWKALGHGLGSVLQSNQNPLVDLRFADDILMIAFSIEQSMDMLRSLVDALRNVGFILNVSKTKLLTTQAQPTEHVWVDLQTKIDIIRNYFSQMVGMLSSCQGTKARTQNSICLRQPERFGPTNGSYVTSTSQSHYASKKNMSR